MIEDVVIVCKTKTKKYSCMHGCKDLDLDGLEAHHTTFLILCRERYACALVSVDQYTTAVLYCRRCCLLCVSMVIYGIKYITRPTAAAAGATVQYSRSAPPIQNYPHHTRIHSAIYCLTQDTVIMAIDTRIFFLQTASVVTRAILRTTSALCRRTLGGKRHRPALSLLDSINSGLTPWRLTV